MAATRMRLNGSIVTMDAAGTVHGSGSVYVDGPDIAAVQRKTDAPPSGWENVPAIETGGTIYPGLMDLHNHLSYNALRLWNVPTQFGDRGQWSRLDEYHQLVSGPMAVLGRSADPAMLPSLVRYVEAKCLVAGVTTSQGIALFSAGKIPRYFKGLVRNVESPGDDQLRPAGTHVPDVAASDWSRFDAEIQKLKKLLLHLAEGRDAEAETHFQALQSGRTWAISTSLIGIHCAALTADDFKLFQDKGGSMVWSPLSNYLLYGGTADVAAAKAAGVEIALGADWSPTGSKNLLAELKVARVVSRLLGDVFTDEELVRMATSTAAKILGWDKRAGSIEKGKVADLLVIDKKPETSAVYEALIKSRETDIALVMIRGVPRIGTPALMKKAGVTSGETIAIGREHRLANWDDPEGDPDVDQIDLAEARATLTSALAELPKSVPATARARSTRADPPKVALALEEQEDHGFSLRPHLALRGKVTGLVEAERAAKPVPLKALDLDKLTTADDAHYLPALLGQRNLPEALKDGLEQLL